MQFKSLAFAALVSTACAQTMDLAAALNSSSELTSLNNLLGQFPALVSQLSSATNITLLAPNNNAISALLNSSAGMAAASNPDLVQALLTYHVLSGTYSNFTNETQFIPTLLAPGAFANVTGGQVVEATSVGGNATFYSGLRQNSTAVGAAMNFTGGVIHIVDAVLTIPENISSTALAFGASSIYGALQAANLTETVDTTEDLTVFVPNNAAFQAIGSALPNLTTQEVVSILSYHVVAGTVAYSSTLSNTTIQTLEGTNLTITVYNATHVYVNSARVILPDILVANGVVHVIDNVLNPGNATATPNPTATTDSPAFGGASSATEAPFTSGVPSASTTGNTRATATATSSSSSGMAAAWVPKPTAIGAALIGGLGMVMAL